VNIQSSTISLKNLLKCRILVIGDVIIDKYWKGTASRISPEAPVPVVNIQDEYLRLGGAANVALNVTNLGAKAYLLGICGNDSNADLLENLLEAHQVDHHLVRISSAQTVSKLRVLSQNQQLIRLDFEKSFPKHDSSLLETAFLQHLDRVDAVILSDYNKGTLSDPAPFISVARKAGLPVIVDPKGIDFSHYKDASILTPNQSEFEAVAGKCHSYSDLLKRGEYLRKELNLDGLLITMGAEGMCLLVREQQPQRLSTRAKDVFDVTGAGDTVTAILGLAIATGMSYGDAVNLANIAAGVVVSKLGTATLSLDELEESSKLAAYHSKSKIIVQSTLANRIKSEKNKGKKIVMTNGCFDILHKGHVTYLEKARSLGDCLIVAVNDDTSVRRLKGPDRPINNLECRMTVLAGLGCVDFIVPFAEDTPERLITELLPDILVKGADYKLDQIAGRNSVINAGGEIIAINLVPGCSTSNIIDQIQNLNRLRDGN
jgi:D-beta-D-heptose 7-phosphate kinase/D-beta-D-heptose 1-phosphate adenosyltransferase